jgi:hypothetical protein
MQLFRQRSGPNAILSSSVEPSCEAALQDDDPIREAGVLPARYIVADSASGGVMPADLSVQLAKQNRSAALDHAEVPKLRALVLSRKAYAVWPSLLTRPSV